MPHDFLHLLADFAGIDCRERLVVERELASSDRRSRFLVLLAFTVSPRSAAEGAV